MQRRIQRLLQFTVVIAALATVPLTIAQTKGTGGALAETADWTIWSIFVLEYTGMMAMTAGRRAYARANWLTLAIIIISFPVLPSLLALVRLARLARLARLIRPAAMLARGLPAFRAVLGRRGLPYVAALAAILVFACGGALAALEGSTVGSFWEGIWWAVVTVTTVGYGDIAPTTLGGRLLAVVLMVAGIGLISAVTASVAAYFVGRDETPDFSELARRLDRIERLLAELAAGAAARQNS